MCVMYIILRFYSNANLPLPFAENGTDRHSDAAMFRVVVEFFRLMNALNGIACVIMCVHAGKQSFA